MPPPQQTLPSAHFIIQMGGMITDPSRPSYLSSSLHITPPLPLPQQTLPSAHFIIQMGGMITDPSRPSTIFLSNIHGPYQSSSSSAYSSIPIEGERSSSLALLPYLSSNHTFASSSLSPSNDTSTSNTSIFTPPAHEIQLTIRPPFQIRYYDELRTMSFAVLVGLFGVDYERVNGCLVPTTLFKSHPILFNVFVVLIFLTFSASLVGKTLRGRHEWINKYLFPLALSSLMASLYIYMWDLLPGHLKWIPYALLVTTYLVLLTLLICEYKHKYIQDDSNSNANASSIPLVADTIIQDESNTNANASNTASSVADTVLLLNQS
ncbi:hypothetical protein FRX31_019948 [Thalictrum thalictroides]|uniref:Transmembrane protein n=1 Tax=Thalictrum thalictroides TaxID=46969 RepID=A0A7J6W2D7_THATH|nr:hypothetical protein FRX31_019948 [Thalictrum thalictroides]